MCDFSLQAKASRPAVVGETLIITDFHTGTRGFSPDGTDAMAVCVLPGTELAFDENITTISYLWTAGPGLSDSAKGSKLARFRQLYKDQPSRHHDALELPGGEIVMLTILHPGQRACVLQLPAVPTTPEEAEEQRRAEFVG